MRTTTPVALAKTGEKRAEGGLFSASDAPKVIANINQDLEASGASVDTLVARYSSAVPSEDRQEKARRTLEELRNGKLGPDGLQLLVEVLYFAGYQRLLAKHHIRFPAYNVLDEYFTNATAPWGPVVLPRPRAGERKWSLFGRSIGFPIGLPASVLTGNARWVQYFASNGFNVLTYKTIRSRAHSPNEAPNWAFVPDCREPFEVTDKHYAVMADPWDWVNPGARDVTTTNSFGVPSPEPSEWMADVQNALTVLADDQLLIVSVMGDDYESTPARLEVVARDFADTAAMAEAAGAQIIELNLSCPNSIDPVNKGVKPPLCYDVDITTRVLEEVRDRLDANTQLVAKLSYLDENRLAELVERIAPLINGIAGINTLQCSVERANGESTFPDRPLAGVSGIAIREYAKDFVSRLARLRVESGHYFEILGMGGVTDSDSFEDLYNLGATAVQTASGAFANPFLASECIRELGEKLPTTPYLQDPDLIQAIRQSIVNVAAEGRTLSRFEIASVLPLRPSQTYRILQDMVTNGELSALPEDPNTYRTVATQA